MMSDGCRTHGRLVRIVVLLALALLLSACGEGCETTERLAGLASGALNEWTDSTVPLEESFADSDQAHEWEMSVQHFQKAKHGDKSIGGADRYYLVNYQSETVPGFAMQNVLKIPSGDSRSFDERAKGLFELHTDMMLERVPDKQGFMQFWAKEFPDRPIANISEQIGAGGTGETRTFQMTAPKGGVQSQEDLEKGAGPTVTYTKESGWQVAGD